MARPDDHRIPSDSDDTPLQLKDSPWNPLRIKPPEGQMMAVMKGNRDGPLDFIVESISGWHFLAEEPNAVITEEVDKWDLVQDNEVSNYEPPEGGMLEEEFGLLWVGFIRGLYIPKVKYTKWEKKERSTSTELVSKDRTHSPFFYFQYNMAVPSFKVEAEGMFTVDVIINVVVRLRNPYKAMFLAGGWEALMAAAIQGTVRHHVGGQEIADLRKEAERIKVGSTASNGKVPLTEKIIKLSEGEKGLLKLYGIEIIDAQFIEFELASTDEEVKDALTAKEVAKLRAEAAVETAKEIRTIAAAEAEGETGRIAAYGGDAGALAVVRSAEILGEAIKEGKQSVLVLGNTPVAIPLNPNK